MTAGLAHHARERGFSALSWAVNQYHRGVAHSGPQSRRQQTGKKLVRFWHAACYSRQAADCKLDPRQIASSILGRLQVWPPAICRIPSPEAIATIGSIRPICRSRNLSTAGKQPGLSQPAVRHSLGSAFTASCGQCVVERRAPQADQVVWIRV